MSDIHQKQFDNGLSLVAEPVTGAHSLAMTLLVPAGFATEPSGQQGVSALLSEMIWRGAGNLDARGHSDALDALGVDRGSNVQMNHLCLYATMISSKLPQTLPLLADAVRRASFPEEAFTPSRDLALQDLAALEDEPQRKVFITLHQRHFPQPFGRTDLGRREDIEKLSLKQLKDHWERNFVPNGAVLGVAGKFDWAELQALVEEQFGEWRGSSQEPSKDGSAVRGYLHEHSASAQVHIGLAFDAVTATDPHYEIQKMATAVLSGGMSGRLFTQVREKRGLCYAVSAAFAATKHHGVVRGYAGTTAARAQETLDVFVSELQRLRHGVEPDEFERVVVGIKSSLVMQGESTAARAQAIAMDQFNFGRPRSLDELTARVNQVTLDKVNSFVADNAPEQMTVVTVGPDALTVK